MDVVAADRAALNAAIEEGATSVRRHLAAGPNLRLGAGHGLSRHASTILKELEARQQRADARTRRAAAASTALNSLRRVLHLVRVLDHAVGLLRRPSRELGLGALYFAAEIAHELVGEDIDLIEAPRDAPQFATVSWPYSTLLTSQPLPGGSMPILLHYPGQKASCALLVPLLVHELGHPANLRHDLVDKIDQRLKSDGDWKEASKKLLSEGASAGEALVLLKDLIEECLCDAIATACLGPSYLLAFAGWAGLDSADEWHERHPPTLLRLIFVRDQLVADGWDLGFIQGISDWIDGLDPLMTLQWTVAEKDKAEVLRIAAKHVTAIAEEHLGEDFPRLRPADYQQQVGEGLEALYDQDILPAQLSHSGTAADRRCILLAGWKWAIGEHGDGPLALVKALGDEGSQSYIDKALEMSTLLERWTES